ncbi:permease prefix domain 2-containing transporter [Emticicia sp. C21]|uniref:permease prefix domain 2-containing transporter n=1 Tax=Emticicia sp. C21 TaxID=2302915 RepID=UPI000E35177D|nr:permease prefix domain 2-containing transporter [Emticicia sp. C21]RFS16526.1 ABC transporter permease [Emticicia sp. C21]
MKPQPPRWADKLLEWFCAPHLLEEVQGDLHERFYKNVRVFGERLARREYIIGVLSFIRPFALKRNVQSSQSSIYLKIMISNYFKIAFRNFLKHKGYSAINLFGLATGMAVAILIGLWIYDEVTFNQSHENYARIGRVMQHQTVRGERSTRENNPIPLGKELRSSFSGDFKYVVMATQTKKYIISSNGENTRQKGSYMEADAPEMLSLKMLKGTRTGLSELNTILLSETLANTLFGDEEPLNKIIKIDNELNVKVTGVYEDFAHNSEFNDLAFIAPFNLLVASYDYIRDHQDDWGNNFLHIYTQIAPSADFDKVSAKIKDTKLKHVDVEYASRKPELFIQPMSGWHLYSAWENGANTTSEPLRLIWFYSTIGIFILLLACINFVNLSTARSEKRAKEVGIRKAIGSVRSQLIGQFFSESFLMVALAFVLSILFVLAILPWFNTVASKDISIPWAEPFFWLANLAFIALTAVLAGIYPALYLSSFKPIKALKGTGSSSRFRLGRFASLPRKTLVVIQFTVSVTLIIDTIIVYQQIQFAKSRPVGYTRDGLLMIPKTTDELRGKYEVLRTELKNTGVVAEMAESASSLTDIGSMNGGFEWRGKDPNLNVDFGTLGVTYEYGKTIGWQFVDGRDFSRDFPADSSGFILNEAAVKLMGLKNPVGENIRWDTDFFDGEHFKIVGVVKDMVMSSPFEPIKPTIFFLQGYKNYVIAKINPSVSTADALPKIEAAFKKIAPNMPFDYQFVDETYARKFGDEERVANLATFFAILAIFISCLGLFGLASFVAEQRTKEIGIRKVLGASVVSLWQMLSKDFVILVIISCLIATPIAWYFMSSWLQKYTYRTEISAWVFALVGVGALAICLLTISYQAIKAALMNPVKTLKNE